MSDLMASAVDRRPRRRWVFDDCAFDDASWSLTVGGNRVTVETKPLELLRALLEDAGNLVSKDELLDRVWPNVTVVEGSLPTAVHKLRQVLKDEGRPSRIIETVPRIGYRIAVPVRVEAAPDAPSRLPVAGGFPDSVAAPQTPVAPWSHWKRPLRLLSVLTAVGVPAVFAAFLSARPDNLHATLASPAYTQRPARYALRKLDIGAVEEMLTAGWDPNKSLDDQGNGAINYVLNQCEWDHGHNQEQILLMIRTLTDEGAAIDDRNVWGDTPYSIAKAPRYCGPDHPVTRYLQMMCAQGQKPLGDRCMASYELARGHHFVKDPVLAVASR